jgi:hypothetical protein
MQKITHKRGDTFAQDCQRVDANGVAVDITGLTVTSTVQSGSFTDTLTVDIVSALTGEFTLTKADTTAWPISSVLSEATRERKMLCDVKFANGTIARTETFEIAVVERITP